jgi:hypothetical protein
MVFLDKGIARLFGEFFALSCLGAILFCTSALVVTAHRPVRPVDDERERQKSVLAAKTHQRAPQSHGGAF